MDLLVWLVWDMGNPWVFLHRPGPIPTIFLVGTGMGLYTHGYGYGFVANPCICLDYCTISFNSAVTHHAPPPDRRLVMLITLIFARCWKLFTKMPILYLWKAKKIQKIMHGCRKKKLVALVLAACRNQNFGRPITHHAACRIEWNSTVNIIFLSYYILPFI